MADDRPGEDRDASGGDAAGPFAGDGAGASERDGTGAGDAGSPTGAPTARGRLRGFPTRARAIVGLAWRDLAFARGRTLLAVAGVALAVLTLLLLAGTSAGVLETGTQQFDRADRDLWVTGESIGLTTAGGGGFEATIHDAHEISAEMESRPEVSTAAPMAFQTLYVGTDPENLETVVATGVPGGGSAVSIREGSGFTGSDTHYADGTYDGPLTKEVLIDERIAERFDVAVGDELHLGGSITRARETRYEVVGVSNTFSSFLGTPTVTIRTSELQTLSGTAGTDAATMIAITVADGADVEAVHDELQAAYPEYAVRTNEEQLEAVVGQQTAVFVGAGLLGAVAVLTGAALTATLLALHVYQRRETFRTLRAVGVGGRSVASLVFVQGALVGLGGWLVAIAAADPAADALNRLVARVVGFDGLVAVPDAALPLSAVVAIGLGTVAGVIAVWRLPAPASTTRGH
ncbi:ABC transporter permease [Halovivax limisalsi]|uniref:ABC transporter permease n=1 Tax=Halovivax limisalsi TaxID=1453760 RepID=UPI001FFCD081|nr:ABC transporter permease [Halovivax limisalsi]